MRERVCGGRGDPRSPPPSAGRYSGRSDAGCLYELTVKLLSEHEDVLAEFSSGQVAVPQDSDDGGWTEVGGAGRAAGPTSVGLEASWCARCLTLPLPAPPDPPDLPHVHRLRARRSLRPVRARGTGLRLLEGLVRGPGDQQQRVGGAP